MQQGQVNALCCLHERDGYNRSLQVRVAQAYVVRFRDSNGELHVRDKEKDIAMGRDRYINIMPVISLPPV